jgi:hypothetical protein
MHPRTHQTRVMRAAAACVRGSWLSQEVREAALLRALLASAPQLASFELLNAGPVLTRTLAPLLPQV